MNEISRSKQPLFIIACTLLMLGSLAFFAHAEETAAPAATADATATPGTVGLEGMNGSTTPNGATIETGDASSTVDASNTINTNTATVDLQPGTTTVTNTNDAVVVQDAMSAAGTGENLAGGGEGNTLIRTGAALAVANVINIVNTNIFNSNGLLLFLNQLFNSSFDLRNFDLSYFFGDHSSGGGCSFLLCGGSTINIGNANTADVTNDVVVRAMTGSNTASSTASSTASIGTGNAYGAANVVNLVNTNLVNSNYLLISLNAFGDLSHDIFLPNADFFKKLFSQGGLGAPSLTVNADNHADIIASTTASAVTGDNMATTTGEGAGSVHTGTALSQSSSFNQVNENLVGGTSVFLLFRVFGNWSGSVHGLPEGISWRQTPYGIELVSDDGAATSSDDIAAKLTVQNKSTATVRNNIGVWALTGANEAQSEHGNASVDTGNAYASAHAVNIVNTNVIGRNWIFAIFNIFGNWNGNISFGAPDLWIGAVAETPNPTVPNSDITYRFTVANHGDAAATGVKIRAVFNKGILSFSAGSSTADGAVWEVGTLLPGETKDIVSIAHVLDVPLPHSVPVTLDAHLSAAETDPNTADNTENLTVVVGFPSSGGASVLRTLEPKLSMTKTVSVSTTTTPARVDYKVVVSNASDSGPAYMTKLTDTLTDGTGATVYTRSWNLDQVNPGEEIVLTYTVEYTASSTPGLYTNTARLTGQWGSSEFTYSQDFRPVEASAKVQVERGQVLGVRTEQAVPPACEALITTYIRTGYAYSPEDVKRLQRFLDIEVTGVYDEVTIAAVKRFQETYRDEILAPWKIAAPTGNVYFTTQRKINEIACGGTAQFSLSPDQVMEIGAFHLAHARVSIKGHTSSTQSVRRTPVKSR